MKLLSLGQKGIAHYLIPLLIIVAVAIGGTAFYVASHAQSCGPCLCKTLTAGPAGKQSTGACVKAVQYMINGFNPSFPKYKDYQPAAVKLVIDGDYGQAGQNTFNQVERWQSISNLAVDGQVGPHTWAKFCFWAGKMSTNWQQSHPNQSPPGYVINAIRSANNAGCSPRISIPT